MDGEIMDNRVYNTFSRNLKLLREFHEMNQEDLAQKIGVSRSNLSYYETSKSEPTLTPLIKISEVFDITIDDLIFKELNIDLLKETYIEDKKEKKLLSFFIFSRNLKILRTQKKMLQVELANELGTSKSNISMYEAGKIEPKLTSLIKISEVFKISIENLVSQKFDNESFINNEKNFLNDLDKSFNIDNYKNETFIKMLSDLKNHYLSQSLKLANLLEKEIPYKIKEIDEIIGFLKKNDNE